MTEHELIRQLYHICKENEWPTRHAAENPFCPYCHNEDDAWEDQKEHHPGCPWVQTMQVAEDYLFKTKSVNVELDKQDA